MISEVAMSIVAILLGCVLGWWIGRSIANQLTIRHTNKIEAEIRHRMELVEMRFELLEKDIENLRLRIELLAKDIENLHLEMRMLTYEVNMHLAYLVIMILLKRRSQLALNQPTYVVVDPDGNVVA